MDVGKLFDPKFWHGLCPELALDEVTPLNDAHLRLPPTSELCPQEWKLCKQLINHDGYFAYASLLDRGLIDRMADCFDRLADAGLVPAFGFVYDEFWQVLLQLRPMLTDLLGDHLLLPAAWAWHVRADNQTAFPPHRDQIRDAEIDDDDHLDYLTIWIPLTDLDHLSSCMCVLPASADPDYGMETADVRVENLQDVRALQGPAGSVFCWTTGLAHWGTRQSSHGEPRKSIGFYAQRAEAEVLDGPPLDFSQPFSLPMRLAVIGQQIIDYSRDSGGELLTLADDLMRVAANS